MIIVSHLLYVFMLSLSAFNRKLSFYNSFFFYCSKRIVNIIKTEDDVHLVHREMANGKQAKSVQVDFEFVKFIYIPLQVLPFLLAQKCIRKICTF